MGVRIFGRCKRVGVERASASGGRLLGAVLAMLLVPTGTALATHLLGPEGHTTLDEIITGGDPDTGYQTLQIEDVDESYITRDPAGVAQSGREERRTSLAYFSQLTDFQLADEESPARVEFLDPAGPPVESAWRPQEALQPFLIDASIRQINRFAPESPVPQGDGSANAMDFSLVTGDQADSMQRNEMIWTRALLEGGVSLNFGSGIFDPAFYSLSNPDFASKPSCPAFLAQEGGSAANAAAEGANYTGVQDYTDYATDPGSNPTFYDPNDPRGDWADWPQYTGLLDRAQTLSFTPAGLDVPSYWSNGNHDVLVQGNEDAIAAFETIATGCFKALATTGTVGSPGDGGGDPSVLLSPGVGMLVPPDPLRRFTSRPQVKAVIGANDVDDDHGFGFVDQAQNTASNDTASYYAWNPPETPGLRFINVDTNSEGGVVGPSANGNIDDPQFQWLGNELDAAEDGGKLVVLFGHHPVRTMNSPIPDEAATVCTANDSHGDAPEHDVNPGCDADPRNSSPVHLGDPDIAASEGSSAKTFTELIDEHPNVVAFVAGHTHEHKLIPFTRGDGSVWWEVNSSATADWPQQHRLVEIMDNRDRTLSIFGTVLDFAADAGQPAEGDASGFDRSQLAAIGRNLGYNDPQKGPPSGEGTPDDQNVEMVIGDPREADLKLSKSDSPDPVAVDGVLTYTLTVEDQGPYFATGPTVTDELPAGVDFLSASAPGGSCTQSAGTVSCDLADIANGDSTTVTVRVRPQSTGQISNQASVEGILPDPDPDNNSASTTTTVTAVTCGGEATTIVGTPGGDQGAGALVGTPGPDVMAGRGGDDEMRGRPAGDCVGGNDGSDELHGGRGPDELRGDDGDDEIFPGRGVDQIFGDDGDDEIFAVGNKQDTISCGPGFDRVHAGHHDIVVADCEVVTRGS